MFGNYFQGGKRTAESMLLSVKRRSLRLSAEYLQSANPADSERRGAFLSLNYHISNAWVCRP